MSKVKVAVYGSPLKTVYIDTEIGARVSALETQVQSIQSAGSALRHSQLLGLQQGDDHPQYTMWAATETIKAPWNFDVIPFIQGETLAEYIEDVVGGSGFIQDTDTIYWEYGDTAGTLEANVDQTFGYVWTGSPMHSTAGATHANMATIGLAEAGDAAYFDVRAKIVRAGNIPRLVGARVNGTYAVPTGIRAAQAIFSFDGWGYGGSAMQTGAQLQFAAGSDWSGSNSEGYGEIFLTPSGSTTQRRTVGFWSNGGLRLALDNAEVSVGAGSSSANNSSGDLRLCHDGTDSIIRNDTGILKLQKSTTVFAQGDTDYFDMARAIRRTNVISPAQLVANTDNWNPTGLASASTIRLSTDASRNITGIVAQAAGTEITLCNVGAQDAVLVHNATSTAANQFLCPGSANFTLNANDSVRIWYDSTSSRWRVIES